MDAENLPNLTLDPGSEARLWAVSRKGYAVSVRPLGDRFSVVARPSSGRGVVVEVRNANLEVAAEELFERVLAVEAEQR